MFLYFFLKEIFIFIFPGFALIIFFSKKINAKYVIYSIGLSLSFWIISFWFLKYIPLPLDIFIYLIIIISIIFLGTKIETLSFKKKEKYILLIFILIILLRLIPYFLNYFPAGADMSFHTLTTKIITEKNGFPSDYMPILPFKIGNYPLGFHIISACISIFSNIEEYRATLLLANFSYAFLGFCLYVFLTNYFKPKTSLICSIIATFGTNNPQFFIGWGGNSVVLSICFLFLGASLVENIFKLNFKELFLLSLFSVSSFLVHFIPLYGFFYVYLLVFIKKIKKNKKINSIKKILFVIIIFVIFVLPYFLNFKIDFSQNEFNNLKIRQENKYFSWNGNINNFYKTIPIFMITLFGKSFVILSMTCFLFLIKDKNLFNKATMMLFGSIILIINSKFFFLPVSILLYSERTGILMLIPLTISIGYFIENILNNNKNVKNKYMNLILIISIASLFLIVSVNNYTHYLKVSNVFSMVTSDDLKAFEWINKNTKTEDIFLSNPGDAGLWISALTLRRSTSNQIIPIYHEEADKLLSNLKPNYVFIGKKKVYDTFLDLDYYVSNNNNYTQVYSNHGVNIFKIK